MPVSVASEQVSSGDANPAHLSLSRKSTSYYSHWHEFGVGSGHEVRDRADLALSAPVEPLAEAAV